MKTATADQILCQRARRFKTCKINGLKIRIRGLTEAEKAGYEMRLLAGGEHLMAARVRLFAMMVVDDVGAPLFKADDVDSLMLLDSEFASRLFDECLKFIGFDSVTDVENTMRQGDILREIPESSGRPEFKVPKRGTSERAKLKTQLGKEFAEMYNRRVKEANRPAPVAQSAAPDPPHPSEDPRLADIRRQWIDAGKFEQARDKVRYKLK